ncbi:membrane protein [Jeotgalicoccus coquinae]|uniref:D-methionine transport system substrate-binding protein n=1 Tax=Jeotgalicoccus coquinae TaxID=709509 RepID=A0A6V7RSD1_9STAP|nr:MetQ/NlpA family ABC transporter substrate-binding protein [Jeotgalicoccus coquinae]MBB6424218.1 D-methionine transport system substrate-binding protein [Jeotgalicoccus coquinae]GGE25545.1 membrane protein [Jeotgalicoccus coquinae]CAD2081553.1 Methionine-binding lipoprotein MetQ precursor [Jeotgalicoccus coquinae]
MSKKYWMGSILSAFVLTLAACGGEENVEEDTEITVVAQTTPMTDIVEIAGEAIEEPYTVKLVEVADNIQYNEAVFNDEADASFAQHEPFMEQFNAESDADLVAMSEIYNAIVGFYSPVYDSIDELEDGAEVAIPSDPTNEARALMILDDADIITLADGVSFEASVDDIEENPKDLQFTHVDLLNLSASYEDGIPLVFNYPTYIEPIGLTPEDAVLLEDDDENTFALRVVAREGNEDSEKIEALNKAFTSREVYDFLDELSGKGHLEPSFEPGEE